MNIITITSEQLEIVIRNAIIKGLNIQQNAPGLSERCTFKEALEITGLSKSLLYNKSMNKAIPFGNRLIFSSKELQGWVAVQLEIVVKNAVNETLNIKHFATDLHDQCTFLEALEITGLSKSALYKRTMDNSIRFKKFGNRLIFSRKELIEWVQVNTSSKPEKNKVLRLSLLKTGLGKTERGKRKTEKRKIMSYESYK